MDGFWSTRRPSLNFSFLDPYLFFLFPECCSLARSFFLQTCLDALSQNSHHSSTITTNQEISHITHSSFDSLKECDTVWAKYAHTKVRTEKEYRYSTSKRMYNVHTTHTFYWTSIFRIFRKCSSASSLEKRKTWTILCLLLEQSKIFYIPDVVITITYDTTGFCWRLPQHFIGDDDRKKALLVVVVVLVFVLSSPFFLVSRSTGILLIAC